LKTAVRKLDLEHVDCPRMSFGTRLTDRRRRPLL
jgi:hypothetical protein